MTPQEVLIHRLYSQRLAGPPCASPQEAVGLLGAVQSQDFAGAKWGLAQRCPGVTGADIDALYNAGTILRTHVMRPTWHFVLPRDILWMQQLTAPRVRAIMAYYDRKLGIDAALRARVSRLISAALRGTSLTRAELAEVLHDGGVEAKGQLLAHLVMHVELDAVICSGPLRGKQFTYALLKERAPEARSMSRFKALAELARRYFTSHGPATVQDFAWWSGLSVADVRQAIELAGKDVMQTIVNQVPYWHSPDLGRADLPKVFVKLLPNYDEYTVAYKDHGLVAPPDIKVTDLIRSDALAAHFVMNGGLIVGGWRRVVTKDGFTLRGQILTRLGAAERRVLAQQVQLYGEFVGLPVDWVE